MKFFLHLLIKHLTQYPLRTLTAFIALTIASTIMLTLAGAGAALQFRIGANLAKIFPEERIWLESIRTSFGPVALEATSITNETADLISARPEVEKVYPIECAQFPIVVAGDLFGQQLVSEAVVYGMPRELVQDALKPSDLWEAPESPKTPYPIVGSKYLLDIYNLGLAKASAMPLLNEKLVIGRKLSLGFGTSAFGFTKSRTNARIESGIVKGITSQPTLIALAMPDDAIRKLNEEFTGEKNPRYVKLVVMLKQGADRDKLVQYAKRLNLKLSGGDALGIRVKSIIQIASMIMEVLAFAVLLIGLTTFYALFSMILHARRFDLIRLRALGCTSAEAMMLALGEIGMIAAGATLTALTAVLFAARWASNAMSQWKEFEQWIPPGLFDPSFLWLAAAGCGIVIATLIPALPMLYWAAKVQPAQAIREM